MNTERYMPKLHWHHQTNLPDHHHQTSNQTSKMNTSSSGVVQPYAHVFLYHVERPLSENALHRLSVQQASAISNRLVEQDKHIRALQDANRALRLSIQQAHLVHEALSHSIIKQYQDDPQFVHKTVAELCMEKYACTHRNTFTTIQ